jgi:TRAP-type C4-dicarboxylate transport system permease small subunit
MAIVYGTAIVAESVRMGRATATMLSVPNWMTESAIPLGFGILLLQCLAEMARLIVGRRPRQDGVDRA